jgi:hypothetical protein
MLGFPPGSRPIAYGCGTVFEVTSDGTESVVYAFDNVAGKYPRAGLLVRKGVLYGTLSKGGEPFSA